MPPPKEFSIRNIEVVGLVGPQPLLFVGRPSTVDERPGNSSACDWCLSRYSASLGAIAANLGAPWGGFVVKSFAVASALIADIGTPSAVRIGSLFHCNHSLFA